MPAPYNSVLTKPDNLNNNLSFFPVFVLGIDFFGICAKVWVKSRDGDTRAGKILREGAVWWKASGCLPGSYHS